MASPSAPSLGFCPPRSSHFLCVQKAWHSPPHQFGLTIVSLRSLHLSTLHILTSARNPVLIGVFTPPLIALSPSATFLLFSLACAAAYFWSTRYVPETAGKSLEEIDAGFSASAGTADRDKRRQEEIRLGLPKLVHEIIGIPYTRVPSRGAV